MKEAITTLFSKRPTETLTGPPLGLAVYGFCTQVGLPPVLAGIAGGVAAFGPLLISQTIDRIRRRR